MLFSFLTMNRTHCTPVSEYKLVNLYKYIIVASVVQCYLEEQEECLWNIEEGSSSSKSVLSGNSP